MGFEPLVCSPEHIGVLAAYGHKKSIDPLCWYHPDFNFTVDKIATALAEVNTSAWNEWKEDKSCYGTPSYKTTTNGHKNPGFWGQKSNSGHDFGSDAEYTEACRVAADGYYNNPPSLTAIELIKLAEHCANQCHSPFWTLDYPEEKMDDREMVRFAPIARKVRYAQLVINKIVMRAMDDIPGYKEAPEMWTGKTDS